MTEVRSKKQAAGPSLDEGVLPDTISEKQRQQILSEKDTEKKRVLIELAWEEYNNPEPEFVSQSRKRTQKPKPATSNTANGTHGPGRGDSKRPSNGAKPHGERRTGDDRRTNVTATRKGPDAKGNGTAAKPTGAESSKAASPAATAAPVAPKPATAPAAPKPAAAPVGASDASAEASKPKAVSSSGPVQSAWTGKPLSKKLSEKPEEERRLAEEKAKQAEIAKQQEAAKRLAAEEEKKRKSAEQPKQTAPAPAPQAPAPAAVPEQPKPSETSYLARAKNAAEKKKMAPAPASAQKPAAPTAAAPVAAAPSQAPAQASAPAVVPAAQAAAPAPAPAAVAAPQPASVPTTQSFEPKSVNPEPVASASVAPPVRVPEGFGATSMKLNFGDFSVDSSANSAKFGAVAPAQTSAWADDSKKGSDAANSAFINNLMAGSSGAATSVQEVESQLRSAAAASSAPEPVQESPVLTTPAQAPAATLAPAAVPAAVPPTAAAPAPSMMNASFPRIQQHTANAPMAGGIPKKGGRGQGAGVAGGRGGAVLGGGMRMGGYPVDAYGFYQPEHTQGQFGMPYPDPMYPGSAQFGYGNDMNFYAQQQHAQQPQQQQQAPSTSSGNAPPGLGGSAMSTQVSSGEFPAGQNTPEMTTAGQTQQQQQQQQQHAPHQGGYMGHPYGSYGQASLNQHQGFLQQQATQQQQPAGAGSLGQSSQQEHAGYPASHPNSFGGAASYPPHNMYAPYYGQGMYYPPQYSTYAPPTQRYTQFAQPMAYGQAPLPQDQSRQTSGGPYYGQGLSGVGAAGVDSSSTATRSGPPGYGAPSFAAQQQQQSQPASEPNWASQQESYGYRPAQNYYQQSNSSAGGSSAQEWRRHQ